MEHACDPYKDGLIGTGVLVIDYNEHTSEECISVCEVCICL